MEDNKIVCCTTWDNYERNENGEYISIGTVMTSELVEYDPDYEKHLTMLGWKN